MRVSLRRRCLLVTGVCSLLVFALLPSPATATHSWNGYHWARTGNPFTLKLGNNLSGAWASTTTTGYLSTTSNDWSKSSVLDTTIVSGGAVFKQCLLAAGRVQVCNGRYGNNGYLGLAQVRVSGSHITGGTVKLNDTYFNTAAYNTAAWRNSVLCQEVGHTLGLDHQDVIFGNSNLGTCMDYTNDPSTNQSPNQHDYDQLVAIYTHLDSTTTVGSTSFGGLSNRDFENRAQWGRLIRTTRDGRPILFERDLGPGEKLFTWVIAV